jgi:hypothetical protein
MGQEEGKKMVFGHKWGRKENKNNKVFNHKGVKKKRKKPP